MKIRTMVVLCVVVLAGSAFAGDGNRKNESLFTTGHFSLENGSPNGRSQKTSIDLIGVLQFAVWKTRTGEMVIMPQEMNAKVEALLTLSPGPFADLYTKETWGDFMVREMNWKLVIGRDGEVTASFPRHATYYYEPPFTVPSEEDDDVVASHAEMTGCPEYGTWPRVHGHFDGRLLDIATEQQGVCTGGTYWKDAFGVSEAMGSLHTDVILSLEAVE